MLALIACSWLQLHTTYTTHIISNTLPNNPPSKFTQTQYLFNTKFTSNEHQLHTNFINVLSSTSTSSQAALVIILPQLYLHLEFVNPDFSTPYGITFNLLHSVVIVISSTTTPSPPITPIFNINTNPNAAYT